MSQSKTDLLQGTLDLVILKVLALEPMHGWGISQRIQQISKDVLQVNQGSLYPALHRLEQQAWIRSKWGASEANRKAKYYELTAAGRKQLQAEVTGWERYAAAIARVIETNS
jgi:transcriptional regulator